MKKGRLEVHVPVPAGVTARVEGNALVAEKDGVTLSRRFPLPGLALAVEKGVFVARLPFAGRRMNARLHTVAAHARNLFAGLVHGYRYTLKAVHAHFPMTLKLEGRQVVVTNFAGEKKPRRIPIVGEHTRVDIKGATLTVTGPDKEAVGQTAANLEQGTKVRGKDRRVFQDGIYIVEKAAPAREVEPA